MIRTPISRLGLALLAGLAFCAASFSNAYARPYPKDPVRIIVPFPPGAGVDIITRLVAAKLATVLGQNFYIENHSGAAGTIGAALAARAKPDGYTLLAAPSSLASSQTLYRNLPYRVDKDFTGIAMMAQVPFVLVTYPKVPASSVAELIALAKSKPNSLTFASTGNGSAPHLATAQFEMLAHISMRHVPYRGTAPAMEDLLSGRIDLMFANAVSVLPQVKNGSLRALAITSSERSPSMPDLPTVAEAGLKGYEANTWFVLMAPRGTPKPIIARLNAAVEQVMQMPDVKKALANQGATTRAMTPRQVDSYVRKQIRLSAAIIKKAKITIN